MKRKIIFVIGMMLLVSSRNADAACVSTDKSYTACKSGYYLSNGTCSACPSSGTSADANDGGITDCYLPAGTKGTAFDPTGSYEYEYINDCYYSE